VIEASNSSRTAISTAGIAVVGMHSGVSASLSVERPRRDRGSGCRQANAAMPAYCVGLAGRVWRPVRCSGGGPGRVLPRGVKETAFSGVFATVEALVAEGANVSVHDPCTPATSWLALVSSRTRWAPRSTWLSCSLTTRSTTTWQPRTSGVKVIVDGRRVLDAAAFPDAVLLVVARPERHRRQIGKTRLKGPDS